MQQYADIYSLQNYSSTDIYSLQNYWSSFAVNKYLHTSLPSLPCPVVRTWDILELNQ